MISSNYPRISFKACYYFISLFTFILTFDKLTQQIVATDFSFMKKLTSQGEVEANFSFRVLNFLGFSLKSSLRLAFVNTERETK